MRVERKRARPHDLTIALGGLSAVLLLMGRFWPFDRLPLVECPLRHLAGIPCPTCGMTRAFVALTHGEVGASLHVSPLGALLCLGAAAAAVYVVLRLSVWRRAWVLVLTAREKQVAAIAALVAVGLNWAYLLITRAAG